MRRTFLIAGLVVAAAAVLGLLQLGSGDRTQLAIVSGSENQALEPIILDWAAANRVDVTVEYQGSVDISRILNAGTAGAYDAVWPANSIWIELGDTGRVVKHDASILRSPVVLGLRRSIAEDLGWIGREDITVQMIQEAAKTGAFRLSMTSATQSNSGASAYFGFLYAASGNPDVLTLEHLGDPGLQASVQDLLGQVDRSSGSSGWLKTSFVENTGAFDAMFNYEALVIEANQALSAAGEEPLYAIYPANGLSVADSPLGYVDKGDAAKEEAFLNLQKHLLSEAVQSDLIALGRRAGLIGLGAAQADPTVWRADLGIDLTRDIAPIPTPSTEVIAEALRMYQTELRKPSLTVWVLDVSGSMDGEPLDQLKNAMALLLDPEAAAVNLLQPSARDITIIIPFSNRAGKPQVVVGNAPSDLTRLLTRVRSLEAGGGTDLYGAILAALDRLATYHEDGTLFEHLPAIVVMTDGASDVGNRPALFREMRRNGFGSDVPIHSIAFGQADEAQLEALSEATIGRLFKAGDDLAGALRKAKGYN